MRLINNIIVLLCGLVVCSYSFAGNLIALNKENYKNHGESNGIIILQVNWGRHWNCASYQNAQLQELSFKLLPANKYNSVLKFTIPSKLFAKDRFLPYAYIVKPGKYALSGFDIKVAKSNTDVGHLTPDENKLIQNRKSKGGTFYVNSNEAVYIGSFGLDCTYEPMPWRYYIDGKHEFKKFANGFKKKYAFIKKLPVRNRILKTSVFGQ